MNFFLQACKNFTCGCVLISVLYMVERIEEKSKVFYMLQSVCDLPQLHLLSVRMEANLHRGCPPNCQDFLTWLPTPLAAKIMTYLDPGMLYG
jgi:hypothetical protein